MTQGAIKKSKVTQNSARRYSSSNPKIVPLNPKLNRDRPAAGPRKGQRIIAPKKAVLVKQKKITKVFDGDSVLESQTILLIVGGRIEIYVGLDKQDGKRVGGESGPSRNARRWEEKRCHRKRK